VQDQFFLFITAAVGIKSGSIPEQVREIWTTQADLR
jgi:hypothetical protein